MANKFEQFCVFVIIFLISLGLYAFYLKIYSPAKLSVELGCNTNLTEEDYEENNYILGYYNETNDEVYVKTNMTINGTIYQIKDKYIQRTIKHEYCHYYQNTHDRLNSYCNQKIRFTIDEMECYMAEYLPDFLYDSLYK